MLTQEQGAGWEPSTMGHPCHADGAPEPSPPSVTYIGVHSGVQSPLCAPCSPLPAVPPTPSPGASASLPRGLCAALLAQTGRLHFQ